MANTCVNDLAKELKNSGFNISEVKSIKGMKKRLKNAKEYIDELIDIEWQPDMVAIKDTLEMDPDIIKKYLGYKTVEELDEMALDTRDAAESTNREIDKSIESLEKLHKDMLGSEDKRSMYFDWFYSSNGRYMMDSNTINPQTDKLHRFLVQPKSHRKVYEYENGVFKSDKKDVTAEVRYAIAQGLGFAVDKKSTTSLNEFADNIIEEVNNGNLDEIKKVFKEGDKEVLKENWGIEVEHVSHVVQTLDFLGQLGKTEIESSLTAEFDAVTSGFGLKLLQFPILHDMWKWLNKVGIFEAGKKVGSMNDYLDPKDVFDSYQELARQAEPGSSKNKSKLNEDSKFTGAKWWDILEKSDVLPRMDDILDDKGKPTGETEVSGALRNLFKDPFMTFNYSAGIKSIKRSLSGVLIKGVIDGIMTKDEKYDAIAEKLAAQITGVEDVDGLRNELKTTQLDKIKLAGGKNLYSELEKMFTDTYGATVEDIMTENFGKFMQANSVLNSSFKMMFELFKEEYDKRRAGYEVGEWNEKVFVKEMYEGDNALVKLFPMIKGPLSENIKEGIGIYKAGSQTPTGKDVRYLPSQTAFNDGKEWTTSKVRHMIKDFEAAISSGAVVPIHYIDASIMAQLNGKDMTSIHDAIMPPLTDAKEYIKDYNKAVFDISKKYSVMEQVQERLEEAIETAMNKAGETDKKKFISSKFNKMYTKLYDAKGEEVEIFDKEKETYDIWTVHESIQEVAKETKEGREKLLKDGEIGSIGHMAGLPGSMWESSPEVEEESTKQEDGKVFDSRVVETDRKLPREYYNEMNKVIRKVFKPKVKTSRYLALSKSTLENIALVSGQYNADKNEVTLSKTPSKDALKAEMKGMYEQWYTEESNYAKKYQNLEDDKLVEVLGKDEEFKKLEVLMEKDTAEVLADLGKMNGMHTLAHEMVHVGASEYMEENPNSEITKQVKEIYELAKKDKERILDMMGKGKDGYWMTSIDEFIAEGLSNPDMVYALKNTKYKGKKLANLFRKLVDNLLKMIGVEKESNAYEYLLDGYVAMIEARVNGTEKDADRMDMIKSVVNPGKEKSADFKVNNGKMTTNEITKEAVKCIE